MGSMLKALGLTIWGLIAFGLLVVFIFVGYEAANFQPLAARLATQGGPNGTASKS
jgi:hypothetical protein